LADSGAATPRAACNRSGNPQGSHRDTAAMSAFTVTFATAATIHCRMRPLLSLIG
jgi:hypothetical protein